MVRNLKITVDGRSYNVTVEDLAKPGEAFSPPPARSAKAPESVAAPAKPAPAEPPAASPAPAAKPAVAAGENDILSPMTGVLLEFSVKVGDTVEANQQVATIEAMKMKTAVTAQAAGKVLKLCAEPGSPVDSGQVLVSIG